MYERMPIGVMSWGEEMPLWLFTRIAELMRDIGEMLKMTQGGLRFMFISYGPRLSSHVFRSYHRM